MTARESFARAYEKVRRGYGYTESAGGVGIFTLPSLSALPFVRHGFTARTGGVSEGPLSSLNLSFSRGIEPRERTMENYRILAAAAGFSEESMVMDTYEHGVTVRRVDRRDCGAGYTLPPLPPCDALVTDDPAVTLVTGHADCMAFYAVDPVRRAVGLAHAGWRGALGFLAAVAFAEAVNSLLYSTWALTLYYSVIMGQEMPFSVLFAMRAATKPFSIAAETVLVFGVHRLAYRHIAAILPHAAAARPAMPKAAGR